MTNDKIHESRINVCCLYTTCITNYFAYRSMYRVVQVIADSTFESLMALFTIHLVDNCDSFHLSTSQA